MPAYRVLPQQEWKREHYSVQPLRYADIFAIMEWRNGQMDVLRQEKPITPEMQENYYRRIVEPGFDAPAPTQLLFSFLENGTCIGYGGLTNISWAHKRAELSFLVNTERVADAALYRKDFSAFISLMKNVLFEGLDFNRLFTETYDIRPLHIAILQENGFIPEGRMREHVIIDGQKTDSLLHGFLKTQYEFSK